MGTRTYTAPQLTVVMASHECGYAVSDPTANLLQVMWLTEGNSTYRETETFSPHASWTEDDNDRFWQ